MAKCREKNLKIWDYANKQYHDVITTGDFLTCFYGGKITVVEVNNGTEIAEDKYYALERIKIRSSANGPQIKDKAFIPGAIVKICKPLEQKEEDGYNWVKINYDGDINKEGWVAFEYLGKLPEPVKGHVFKYKWKNSQYVTQDFLDKAAGVSKALGIDPDDLMAAMAFESYLNPVQKNLAGGSATGLVQFMPEVATEINTTTTDLAKMSGVEQLDYVFGYMYAKKGIKTLSDIYMRVLCPDAIGQADNYPVYSKADQDEFYKWIGKTPPTNKAQDISQNYAWEASVWEWAVCSKGGGIIMNDYVTKYGEGENIFLVTQYFINSYLDKADYPYFDSDLSDIRKGAAYKINYTEKWTNIKTNITYTGTLEINNRKYRLPLNYSDRLQCYTDAIKIFK